MEKYNTLIITDIQTSTHNLINSFSVEDKEDIENIEDDY